MIFLFPRWDMLIPWRVSLLCYPLSKKRLRTGGGHGWSHGEVDIIATSRQGTPCFWATKITHEVHLFNSFWVKAVDMMMYIYTYDHICKYIILDISFYIHITILYLGVKIHNLPNGSAFFCPPEFFTQQLQVVVAGGGCAFYLLWGSFCGLGISFHLV